MRGSDARYNGSQVIVAPQQPSGVTIRVRVTKVFDGDAFAARTKLPKLLSNEAVGIDIVARLGFIDAPEMGQPGGVESHNFLASIISDQWLDLAILTKMDTGSNFDRHRRVVCVPFLAGQPWPEGATAFRSRDQFAPAYSPGQAVTRNIELEMVLNGWAWVVDRYCPDESYFEALEDAQLHRRGIWAFEDNMAPWEFKRRQHKAAKEKAAADAVYVCPQEGCGGRLMRRAGKFGDFLGCSRFPACRYTCAPAY